jgi:hypothetical protein
MIPQTPHTNQFPAVQVPPLPKPPSGRIAVEVIDIFGNHTMTLIPITAGELR